MTEQPPKNDVREREAAMARILEKKRRAAQYLGKLNLHRTIVEFMGPIQKKYSDYQTYAAYHVLVGSTTIEPARHTDFPDEDSVEKFLDGLLEAPGS